MKPGFVRLLILLLWGGWLGAQGSQGTDFWLSFPANYDGGPSYPITLSLFITSGSNASGTVSVPGLGYSQPFNVVAGTVVSVPVTNTALLLGTLVGVDYEGVSAKGVHVVSDQPITVYGLNREQYTTDAYLALPVTALGTSYRVASYSSGGSELSVVATEDGTQVTVTLPVAAAARGANVPYSFILNKGQTYQILKTAWAPGSDLTGALVTADKPVAVFGAHRCADVPNNYGACDHLVEQMAPLDTWGKHFFTFPLATRLKGDIFRVVADQPNTVVNLNGAPVATLGAGQFYELTLTAASVIESSEPIMLVQYSAGTGFDNVTSDPFMMLIPPDEQYSDHYTVSAPATGFMSNFVNVVVPSALVGAATLDGVAVAASSYIPIGGSGYYGAALAVSPGEHHLGGPGPFGVWVYGFDQADSYGYPGGTETSPVALVDSLIISPKTAVRTVGETHCVTATALAGVSPVAGVRVDFVRTGVHPATAYGYTDAAGQALWCWTGTLGGGDDVAARLGSLSDTAHVDWNLYTPTVTPTATPSATVTVSATITVTPSITPTFTVTLTHTVTPTLTPTIPPLTLTLYPANPDPAKEASWLPYALGTDAEVDIVLWTVAGERVHTWNEGLQRRGTHEILWNLRNEAGRAVASGIYIYRIRARSPAGEERSDFRKCAVTR